MGDTKRSIVIVAETHLRTFIDCYRQYLEWLVESNHDADGNLARGITAMEQTATLLEMGRLQETPLHQQLMELILEEPTGVQIWKEVKTFPEGSKLVFDPSVGFKLAG